jgi:carboxyl-terminal processing protease
MKNTLMTVIMLSLFLAGCNRHKEEHAVIGIGIGLVVEKDGVTIALVLPNTPASRAGLSPGLVVQKIDGITTVGMQSKDWIRQLRGPVGTKVQLEIVDANRGQTNIVVLNREKIILPP